MFVRSSGAPGFHSGLNQKRKPGEFRRTLLLRAITGDGSKGKTQDRCCPSCPSLGAESPWILTGVKRLWWEFTCLILIWFLDIFFTVVQNHAVRELKELRAEVKRKGWWSMGTMGSSLLFHPNQHKDTILDWGIAIEMDRKRQTQMKGKNHKINKNISQHEGLWKPPSQLPI